MDFLRGFLSEGLSAFSSSLFDLLRSSLFLHLDLLNIASRIALWPRMIHRKEGESWRAQSNTTACFAGHSSELIRGTRNTRTTVPNPVAAKRAKRRVGVRGSSKRRTRTTFAGPRMWRESRRGERSIRGTGGAPKGNGGYRRRRRLRYKISARCKRLKSLMIVKTCHPLRYKISCCTNPLFSLALSPNLRAVRYKMTSPGVLGG